MPRKLTAIHGTGSIALAGAAVLAAGLILQSDSRGWAEELGTALPSENLPAPEAPPQWDDPKREKMVSDLERKLGRLKPVGDDKRKSPDDLFLMGTAVIDPQTKHADVRFMVQTGQRATSEYIVDFVAAHADTTVHKWQVFARFKDPGAADQALMAARQQYDQMVAYRERLKRIYKVLSTRRC